MLFNKIWKFVGKIYAKSLEQNGKIDTLFGFR